MKILPFIILLVASFSCFSQSIDYKIAQLKSQKENLLVEKSSIESQIKALNDEIKELANEKTEIANSKIIAISEITMSGIVRENPTLGDNELFKLKKGTKVEVLAIEDDYYKIKHDNKIGYINNVFLYDPALVQMAKDTKQKIERSPRKSRLQILTEKYGSINATRIIKKEIWLGMTDEMARASIGSPDDINRTTYSFGVHEQWIYEGINYKNKYLYFEDGKLVTIQD